MKSLRLSVIFCFIFIFTACSSTPPPPPPTAESSTINALMGRNWKWRDPVVKLTPQGGGKVVLPGNKGCLGSAAKAGCIRFDINETGTITFALPGPTDVKTCLANGVQNVITRIEFTDKASTNDPDKGDFYATLQNPIPQKFQKQAITQLDVDTGMAYEKTGQTHPSGKQAGETRVPLINVNGPGNSGAPGQSLWYRVTITSCDGNNTWVTDPRLVNDGMN